MRYTITVRGKQSTWSFHADGTPEDAVEWSADGLDVALLCNTIPEWLPQPLHGVWVWLQDWGFLPL